MPLTEKGKEALRKFVKKYGKKKGESVFYATRNKYGIKDWEKKK